jgi:peptide/nickel transport system substrate-binding protein
VRESLPLRLPRGMSGFVFNTRRPFFGDARVRQALGYLFDFEWVNRNLFGGVYTRTASYFDASDLSADGHPADARERALLAPFAGAVLPDVMEGRWRPPVSDGSGRDRDMARHALALLDQAGYGLTGGRLRQRDGGETLAFEIMVVSRDHERLALNFADGLSRIGVAARVRLVDPVQYERRRQHFDYDMLIASWPVSPSPGNEQFFRFGAASADREGSFNFAGVKSPAVDAMIEAMLAARGRDEFVAAVRALDPVLVSGFYVVPLFHVADQWLARASAIGRPATLPLLGAVPETWWRQAP